MKPLKLVTDSLLVILLVTFTTCKDREISNPFDAACPKEIFTPSDFKAEQQGVAVKLNWEQANTNISGFVINRNENDGTFAEVARVDKSLLQWSDENVITDKKYGYQLSAYAGENLSNKLTAYCTPVNKTAVITDAVSGITSTSAVFGGNANNDGGLAITGRGVCYSANVNPTTADNKVEMGIGSGAFSLSVTGLKAGITYYARAYAITKQGTTYGSQVTFTTSFLTVSTGSTTVPRENGSIIITVASNIDWQVSSNQSWCTVNANSGKGDGSVTVTFPENTGVPQRTVTITFTGAGVTSQTITLTQFGTEPPALTITPDNQNVTNVAGSTTFSITSNVSWIVTSDQDWCTISNPSGNGNATLTVNYEANTANTQRIATLSVTRLGLSAKTIIVTQQSAIPTDGLVAYYPFNGNANDESGNGNNGTIGNATLTSDRKEKPNSAYSFNGSNSYIQATNVISGNNFSINVWINTTNSSSRQDFISGGGYSSTYAAYICFTLNGVAHFDFPWVPAGVGHTSVCTGKWIFIALNVSMGVCNLYVNGEKECSFNSTCNINGSELNIGRSKSTLGTLNFNGKIDDVRLYNRPLTENEIQQLYNE